MCYTSVPGYGIHLCKHFAYGYLICIKVTKTQESLVNTLCYSATSLLSFSTAQEFTCESRSGQGDLLELHYLQFSRE